MEQESNKPIELPLVSILMVNYNGQNHLEEFFESVYALNYPKDKFEVVVVDNASKDGSQDSIEKSWPQVKLIRLDENTGFARGNNIGVKHCSGKFIALINNDTVLEKDWLIELVKQAVKEPDALYGSKMMWYKYPEYIIEDGGKLLAWGEHIHLRTHEKDDDKSPSPFLSMYADGCGVLLSMKTYLDLGGFDESYFCYAEDFELSWKAWLKGYRVYSVPTARYYHKASSTLGATSSLLTYLLCRNEMRNIIKFTELPNMLLMLPLFMAYYLAMYIVVYCISEKNYYLIFPIMKSYLRITYEFPSLLRVRKRFQKERKISDRELKKMGLILSFGESTHLIIDAFQRRRNFLKVVEG